MKETVIRPFQNSDTEQLLKMFDVFGDYFIDIDPLQRCIKGPNYAQFFLNKLLKEVQEKEGAFFIAEQEERIITVMKKL